MLLEVPVLDIAAFGGGDSKIKRRLAQDIGRAINDIGSSSSLAMVLTLV